VRISSFRNLVIRLLRWVSISDDDPNVTLQGHTYPLSSGAIRWYAGSTKELSHA
jgi:hypothetical protein